MKNNTKNKLLNEEEIKAIQLDLLKHFINICENNKIKYFMIYGSLLGTIRHAGFIPWDDDIDVAVLREDIPALINAIRGDRYKFINSSIDKKYFSPLYKFYDDETELIQSYGQVEGKNLGVYIDVFVLDNVPLDETKRKAFFRRADKLRFLWSLSCRKLSAKSKTIFKTIFKTIISIPFKIIGFHFFAKKYEKHAMSCASNVAKAIVIYGEGFEKEYVFFKEDLETTIKSFENLKVRVPVVFDSILRKCYGDYMVLPPIKERKKHLFTAYKKTK